MNDGYCFGVDVSEEYLVTLNLGDARATIFYLLLTAELLQALVVGETRHSLLFNGMPQLSEST